MIDHVLGRPSIKFRKIQVFAVVSFWSLYLLRGNSHGPPVLRNISARLSKRVTAWQTLVLTLLWLYIARNFAKIFGLESPEPLANLYKRAYFRATWVTTALDAGFWTAMKIKRKWLRDLMSMVFSVYYLIAAEQADEKVRKVRGLLTVDHLRVSWNKSTTPYLSLVTRIMRPKLMRYPPRAIRIPRPAESVYNEPVNAWLYFDGPLSALRHHTNIVLDLPGGGFVAMTPRHHDDKLMAWAARTGLPVLSLDYRKAPEYPYPYALNEAYDVYHTLVATLGRRQFRCWSLLDDLGTRKYGTTPARPTESTSAEGLVLIYPALDLNIGNWMSDEQMSLIQDQRMRKINKDVLKRKSQDYYKLRPDTPHPSDDEHEESLSSDPKAEFILNEDPSTTAVNSPAAKEGHLAAVPTVASQSSALASSRPKLLKTRLAVSSMISYFNDRVLTPEMMRAMIILYVGPHNRPDFSTDFLLSPLLAPEALLAKFPKTYFLTGERDPLVDDTVIFAGRIRQAKQNDFLQKKELGLRKMKEEFNEKDHVEVTLIPGISHGFLQFVSVFPEGWKHVFRCGRWIEDIFEENDELHQSLAHSTESIHPSSRHRHHRRMPTESSGDEDMPLHMSTISTKAESRSSPRSRNSRVRQNTDRRKQSMVSLASEEDLLGRRMKGLAGGLMGLTTDGTQTP